MTTRSIGRYALLLGVAMGLGACQTGTQPFGFLKAKPADDVTGGVAAAAGPAERDVEAPDVFNLSDTGLWDGRPSLGGVWVAHGSVTEPERVMIRNPDNGRSVVGALFRREFDNPGPRLQVSSDAAEALGMVAGQPQKLDVVALKREEVQVELPIAEADAAPGATPEAAAPSAPAAATGAIASAPLEPVAATAAAALDRADAATGATAPAAEAAAAAGPAATAGGGTTVRVKPGQTRTAAQAAAPSAPLTAMAPAAGFKRPYLQIGIFSVEANARTAAAQMGKAGLTAEVKADQSNGKSFWRVIVGPAASEADRAAFAAKVKGLGYPDAYPVSK